MGKTYEEMAEEMLKDFSLEEILEQNDLTHEDTLALLISQGVIGEPERYFP